MRVYASLIEDDPNTGFKAGDHCLIVGFLSVRETPCAILVGESNNFATIPLRSLRFEQVTSE